MADYVLSPSAIVDLQQIFADGLLQFGAPQAQRYQHELHGRFQLLADFPGIAGPPVRLRRLIYRFPFGSHAIIFTTTATGVLILRVFHARMDWLRRLGDDE